jgi:hypothetical protein
MAVQLLSPEIKAGILLSLNLQYHNSPNPFKSMPPLMLYLADEMRKHIPVLRHPTKEPLSIIVMATGMQQFGIEPDDIQNARIVKTQIKRAFTQDNPQTITKTRFSDDTLNYNAVCGWLNAFDHGVGNG